MSITTWPLSKQSHRLEAKFMGTVTILTVAARAVSRAGSLFRHLKITFALGSLFALISTTGQGQTITLLNGTGVAVAGELGSTKYFKASIPASQGFVQFKFWGGTGNGDLYIRKGSLPTTTTYDYRPNRPDNYEAKALYSTVPSGDWYFMVKGTTKYSGATITVTWGGSLDTYSDNKTSLAKVIFSEMGVGNDSERLGVGSTLFNRMKRGNGILVTLYWKGYDATQSSSLYNTLAGEILKGVKSDNTTGATHFYSPRSMPKEGEPRIGNTAGGLELVPGVTKNGKPIKNYRPDWALIYTPSFVSGARDAYAKFYQSPSSLTF